MPASSNRIGNNIKWLRKSKRETQLKLSLAIPCAVSLISMYEKGKKIPPPDKLKLIADYYKVSVEAIRTEDFTKLHNLSRDITPKSIASVIEMIFPMVSSPEALKDNDFVIGYNNSKEVFGVLQKELNEDNADLFFESIFNAYAAYQESIEKNETIESAANLLSLNYFFNFLFCPNEYFLEITSIIMIGNPAWKEFRSALEDFRKLDLFGKIGKDEYISGMDKDITAYIKVLRKSPKYIHLADYFIALKYFTGLVSSKRKQRANIRIGMEVMRAYEELDNPYAHMFLNLNNPA